MTTPLTVLHTATGEELWAASAVNEYLGIGKSTFTSCVSKGIAPTPKYSIERTKLWDASEIRQWHSNRPDSPVTNHPAGKKA
jgi:predicted DNA-binding transcriptional regulator AlpA